MRQTVFVFSVLVLACGDNNPGSPTLFLEVTTPVRGAVEAPSTVTVSGRTDGADRVFVNGVLARPDVAGAFALDVALAPGTQFVESIAISPDGSRVRDLRAVSVGAFALSGPVAIPSRIQLGNSGLRPAATEIAAALDGDAIAAAIVGATVKDAGSEAGCDLDRIVVVSGSAPVATQAMFGTSDALEAETTHNPFNFALQATYSDSSCATATGAIAFDTEEIHVVYSLGLTVESGAFAAAVEAPSTPLDHEIILDATAIDPGVVDRVVLNLGQDLAAVVMAAALPPVEAQTEAWLNALTGSDAATVGGVEVAASLEARSVAGGPTGLTIDVTNNIAGEPGHVVLGGTLPQLSSEFASWAVSLDAINRVLGIVWRAGGFGAMGVPPAVRSGRDGPEIVFGEFASGNALLFGTFALRVEPRDGVLLIVTDASAVETSDGGPVEADQTEGLRRTLDEALATLAERLAPYAWPALDLVASGGYLVADTESTQ